MKQTLNVKKQLSINLRYCYSGAEPDIFIWGGALEGPVLQQGELSMVCVRLSERDLKNLGGPLEGPVLQQGELGAVSGLCRTFRKRPEIFWGGHWGGQAKFLGGSGPPWHPRSSAPAVTYLEEPHKIYRRVAVCPPLLSTSVYQIGFR